MTAEIQETLGKYIAEEIMKRPDRAISPEEGLISAGLIDSFSLVDLALFVEETFGVKIEDTELNAESFDTLEQLAELIRQRQG